MYKFNIIKRQLSHSASLSAINQHMFLIRIIMSMLVGGIHAPLKNMSSSVGVTIPNMWKVIKFHMVPNHQPVLAVAARARKLSLGELAFSHTVMAMAIGYNWL